MQHEADRSKPSTGPQQPTAAAVVAAVDPGDPVERALVLAADLAGDTASGNGEPFVAHARGTIEILRAIGGDPSIHVAAALAEPATLLPIEAIERGFGADVARLVDAMRQITRLRVLAGDAPKGQSEALRRMLLAMAADIRVVLLKLASRLQTLRFHAAERRAPAESISRETLEILAPLANRFGLWQLKWELEDLAFRFLEPDAYHDIASALEERRAEREAAVAAASARLSQALAAQGLNARVSGRPKHLYGIWTKMRTKGRTLEGISDLRGLRVIVQEVAQCYAALDVVHALWPLVASEFDDYITRPKPNGYQSLHTVVMAEDGRQLEVQIRTAEMDRFAEYGVASHWRYKERTAGPREPAKPASKGQAASRGAAGTAASFDERIGWARRLLAWQREVGQALGATDTAAAPAAAGLDEGGRIFVLTPQARIIELPEGATAIDFAYHVHTELGHRCRGARVDGQLVALDTPLRNGQTVQIVAAREADAGPSRDWLNPQLGYLRSQRSRSKVRQWFNARELERAQASGRDRVERFLQREGRTSLSFELLAQRLGFDDPAALFVAAGREELGTRQLEEAVRREPGREAGRDGGRDIAHELRREGARETGSTAADDASRTAFVEPDLAALIRTRRRSGTARDGVLVVGVDSLLTQLARCCRPVPPDEISGFVTRGKGVSVHRSECSTFRRMAQQNPDRVVETDWSGAVTAAAGDGRPGSVPRYAVDIEVQADDRTGLLRDLLDVLARDRVNVIAARTATRRQEAQMRLTVEVIDGAQLRSVLASVRGLGGVTSARRV